MHESSHPSYLLSCRTFSSCFPLSFSSFCCMDTHNGSCATVRLGSCVFSLRKTELRLNGRVQSYASEFTKIFLIIKTHDSSCAIVRLGSHVFLIYPEFLQKKPLRCYGQQGSQCPRRPYKYAVALFLV